MTTIDNNSDVKNKRQMFKNNGKEKLNLFW